MESFKQKLKQIRQKRKNKMYLYKSLRLWFEFELRSPLSLRYHSIHYIIFLRYSVREYFYSSINKKINLKSENK